MESSASSARSRSRRPPKRYGCEQPRVFTPPLRELTPQTSLGFSVIEFSREILQIDLLPWQRWLLIHMLEMLPDNSLRFRTVVVLVARQNGKSTLSQVLALWFMYVYGVALVIGTAQDLDVAEEIWQGAVDLVEETDDEDEPVRPELHALIGRVVKVNGKKALVLKSGERYKVKAANRRAGRGLSGDLILLDELREHQTWDAWGAITKTTMARAYALILALSNAGDATSIVLRYLRKLAHAAVGDPDGINADDDPSAILGDELVDEVEQDEDTLGIFEWSAPAGCDIWDKDGWAQANPSLGHTITERAIASAARTDPEWVFRTEVLCQWTDGTLEGPFPPGAWEKSTDADSQIAADSPTPFCLDVSWDRSTSHIGVAGWRDDSLPHIEVVASRAGTDWVVPWFMEKPERAALPVVVQANGAPASSLIGPLREAGIEVIEWPGPEIARGCGALYDRVRAVVGEGTAESEIRHRPQPILDVAAANAATKPLGDAWVWDRRKSPVDAAPLVAVTGALWRLINGAAEELPDAEIF